MTRLFSTACGIGIALACAASHAQSIGPKPPVTPAFFPFQPWYFGGHRASSTPAEAYLNGRANLLRAAGAFNLSTSAAAMNWQAARAMAIQNRGDAVRSYYDSKLAYAAYLRSQRKPADYAAVAGSSATPAPKRLSPEQFDRRTGTIAWPMALRSEAYEALRGQVDELVAPGAPTSPEAIEARARDLRKLAGEMKEQLKEEIREIAPRDYVAARMFLEALANELS